MTIEAAEFRLSEPEDLLANTIAASDKWQELCGAADATAALAKIYFHSLPEPTDGKSDYDWEEYETLLPFALVTTAQSGMSITQDGVGAYSQQGILGLDFELKIPSGEAATDQERGRWLFNRMGEVINEMLEFSNAAGYFTINTLQVVSHEFGTPEDEAVRGYALGRFQIVLTYGIGGG